MADRSNEEYKKLVDSYNYTPLKDLTAHFKNEEAACLRIRQYIQEWREHKENPEDKTKVKPWMLIQPKQSMREGGYSGDGKKNGKGKRG